MASTYINRTAGTPTSQKKCTISFWFKMSKVTADMHIFDTYTDASNRSHIQLDTADKCDIRFRVSNTNIGRLVTTRVFRDPSAWMHIVVALDTTQSTEADRIKLYVNGTQETSFTTATYPSLNADVNLSGTHTIGAYGGGSNYFDGILSHVHFSDGYAYPASTFGSTDLTTGEWKINTSPSITMGTNGFTILKDGNTITDQSSNSNNFTLGGGQVTNLKDNPSNNFCNINLLYNQTVGQGVTVNNCGNTVYYASASNRMAMGSIGMTSGKYYFEVKVFGTGSFTSIGIIDASWSNINAASGYGLHDGTGASGFSFASDGSGKYNNNTQTTWGGSYATNDIVGVAVDCDNSKIYFSINGSWQESGDPTSGSTGTGSAFNLVSGSTYFPAVGVNNGAQVGCNFGNGQYSGSNVVTTNSGDGYSGTDGASKFTYQPPTGYSAISTKGLNE